jgi:hypothetical protein
VSAYIYALVDPRTEEIRYVGKSIRPKSRLSDHVTKVVRGATLGPLAVWILGILADGLRPEMTILESVGEQRWQDVERKWIATLRESGSRLLNIHPGGNGAHTHASLPTEYQTLLGKIPDGEIARQAGLCRETITYHRNCAGIPPAPREHNSGEFQAGQEAHNKIEIPTEIISLLGVYSDKELGARVGVSKTRIRAERKKLGIPATKRIYHKKGTAHHNAKLNPQIVGEIRASCVLHDPEFGVAAIANRLGLHPSTVHAIVKGETWKV